MKSLLTKTDIESVVSLRDALFECWQGNKTVYLAGNGGTNLTQLIWQMILFMALKKALFLKDLKLFLYQPILQFVRLFQMMKDMSIFIPNN